MNTKRKDAVNILLIDDQPDSLLAYEVILFELRENVVKTSSAREALQFLIKNDAAVVLINMNMSELDAFQLASMLREHPRFTETAIVFISAIHLTDIDQLREYARGPVDFIPIPVIPDLLRAKVKFFVDLYRKTKLLEELTRGTNASLDQRQAGDQSLAPSPIPGVISPIDFTVSTGRAIRAKPSAEI